MYHLCLFIIYSQTSHLFITSKGLSSKSKKLMMKMNFLRRNRGNFTEKDDSEGIIEFNVEELEGHMGKLIGRGGFGPVYDGIIKKRQGINVKELHVAIKSSRNKDSKATEQWLAEKEYLPEVKHQNIIKLIGYCETEDKFYLVYPYMQNETVFTHLSGLDWRKTLKIIKGIASAIQKLHEFTPALVHRDLKLDNILLDKNFTPKLADFGKVTPEGEYIISGNRADDIYSFGEIIIQLITKKERTYSIGASVPWRIGDWARRTYPTQKLLHPQLAKTGCSKEAANAITELGLDCVNPQPSDRPTIADVLHQLAHLS